MSGPADLAIRGIGNAVAVPVPEALGRELLKVLIDRLWDEKHGNRERNETAGDECLDKEMNVVKYNGGGTSKDDAIALD